MVIIYTSAFNAEKSIKRTIISVLSQSYTDFVYYILDNASTDKTGAIIDQYAKKDTRIKKLRNTINNPVEILNLLPNEFLKKKEATFFTNLDSDDELKKDYLDKLLIFMQQNNLDISICGSDFIDDKTKRLIGKRNIDDDLILQSQNFDFYFPIYHQFMRTVWGKLFNIELLRNCCFHCLPNVKYGIDTIITMEAFRRARRVGIMSGTLHKYYLSQKSVSYQFDKKRIKADQVLALQTEQYLIDKCGAVSQRNREFLRYVYLNAVKDTLNVLLSSKEKVSEKLHLMLQILQNHYTQDLFVWSGGEKEKNDLTEAFVNWIINQKESYTTETEPATEALALLNSYPKTIPCQSTTAQKFVFLVKLRCRWKKEKIPQAIDNQILLLTEESLLLNNCDLSFCLYYCEICTAVLENNFRKALQNIQEILNKNLEIPEEHVLQLFCLAVNLAAKLEDMELFIYFKKAYILLLLDFSHPNAAKKELADWDTILPEDSDFKKLRKRISI